MSDDNSNQTPSGGAFNPQPPAGDLPPANDDPFAPVPPAPPSAPPPPVDDPYAPVAPPPASQAPEPPEPPEAGVFVPSASPPPPLEASDSDEGYVGDVPPASADGYMSASADQYMASSSDAASLGGDEVASADSLREQLKGLVDEPAPKANKKPLILAVVAFLVVGVVLWLVVGLFSGDDSSSSGELQMAPAVAPPSGFDGAASLPNLTEAGGLEPLPDGLPDDMGGVLPGELPDGLPASNGQGREGFESLSGEPMMPVDPEPFAPVAAEPENSINEPEKAPVAQLAPQAPSQPIERQPELSEYRQRCTDKFNNDIRARGQNPDDHPVARDDYVKNCVNYVSKQLMSQ